MTDALGRIIALVRRPAAEAVLSGTVGALAMVPPGLLFRAWELRVGDYGPRFAALYMDAPGAAVLFLQHVLLGWMSALPLCLLPLHRGSLGAALAVGSVYGAGYYAVINASALPLYFGDPLPWTLGAAAILPSLVVHLVFGASVAGAIWLLRRSGGAAPPAFPTLRRHRGPN